VPRPAWSLANVANNPIETDHSRWKARLRPMRGLKRLHSARVVSAGHAFIQNLRRATTSSASTSTQGIGFRQSSPNSPEPSE
jgi:transposase-like protein